MDHFQQVIDSIYSRLVGAGLASSGSTFGCTEAELHDIERRLAVKLPLSYRRFLQKMGRGAGEFLVGTDWTYPKILNLREHGQQLLQECGVSFRLAENDVVFAMHQGYTFLFFVAEHDDPKVQLFQEGEDGPRIVASYFTEWLSACLDDEIAEWQRVHDKS